MYTRLIFTALFTTALFCSGCKKNTKEEAPIIKKTVVKKANDIKETKPKLSPPTDFTGAMEATLWDSIDDIKKDCKAKIEEATKLKEKILALKKGYTIENTLDVFNQILMQTDRLLPMAELIANVHPKKEVREAAEKCEQEAKKFQTALTLDNGLYQAIKNVDTKSADKNTQRFHAHLLRDYRRSGVDKDEATRKKLAQLNAEIVKLGQVFSKNIRNDRRKVLVDESDLEGLPTDFIASLKKQAAKNKTKKLEITTDYPSFYPIISYAKKEDVRKAIYKEYLSRAYPKNEKILKELLGKRYEYAKLLGYSDWADYNAEDKMVKNKKVIADFLKKVVTLARPRMKKDLESVLARKKKDDPKATTVQVWDRFYYVNKLRKERFGINPQEVREYFSFNKVKAGLLNLAQRLYAISFKKVNAKVWHPSVEAYDVYDQGKKIARFYLDLHPREGKYGHAAEFPILTGIPGKQLPTAALVTNFPDPAKSSGPALTEHNQVVTFFHEFGHLMHQLLAGKHKWVSQSGINCEWDFVEAPSQLFEEWAWNMDILKNFAFHHKTKKLIPAATIQKMLKAKELGKGMHLMRQMFYANLSFELHKNDPKTIEPMKVTKELYQSISPFPYVDKTAVYANFGHLNGYSSMYYTYMWSLVIAKDLFTRFKKEGLESLPTSLSYRKEILEPGGTIDADKMVENFLGRKTTFNAYETWLDRS